MSPAVQQIRLIDPANVIAKCFYCREPVTIPIEYRPLFSPETVQHHCDRCHRLMMAGFFDDPDFH